MNAYSGAEYCLVCAENTPVFGLFQLKACCFIQCALQRSDFRFGRGNSVLPPDNFSWGHLIIFNLHQRYLPSRSRFVFDFTLGCCAAVSFLLAVSVPAWFSTGVSFTGGSGCQWAILSLDFLQAGIVPEWFPG